MPVVQAGLDRRRGVARPLPPIHPPPAQRPAPTGVIGLRAQSLGAAAPRPFASAALYRRGSMFRLAARLVLTAFIARVFPAMAFADLSVPFRIPIAEWRKAIRKEMLREFLCVMLPKPGEEGNRGQRPPRSAAFQMMRVSIASPQRTAPRAVEEAIAQGYTRQEARAVDAGSVGFGRG